MVIAVYMLLGLALVGGLYWALTQFTVRQRRLTAELSRLEQLTAEVSMNAEALLERVDERTERLAALLAMVEARAEAAAAAPAPQAPAPDAPTSAPEPPKKGSRSRKQPKPEVGPATEAVAVAAAAALAAAVPPAPRVPPAPPAPPAAPAPSQRYQELRSAVWALVDQGKEPGAIAQELGLPRGEVLLLINLRSKKGTA